MSCYQVHLDFVLGEESSTVTSSLSFVKNPASPAGASTDVVLNGRHCVSVIYAHVEYRSTLYSTTEQAPPPDDPV